MEPAIMATAAVALILASLSLSVSVYLLLFQKPRTPFSLEATREIVMLKNKVSQHAQVLQFIEEKIKGTLAIFSQYATEDDLKLLHEYLDIQQYTDSHGDQKLRRIYNEKRTRLRSSKDRDRKAV